MRIKTHNNGEPGRPDMVDPVAQEMRPIVRAGVSVRESLSRKARDLRGNPPANPGPDDRKTTRHKPQTGERSR